MTRFGQKHFDDGIAKGEAGALARLLEKRFGVVPGARSGAHFVGRFDVTEGVV